MIDIVHKAKNLFWNNFLKLLFQDLIEKLEEDDDLFFAEVGLNLISTSYDIPSCNKSSILLNINLESSCEYTGSVRND